MNIGLAELAIVLLVILITVGGAAVVVLGMTASAKDPAPRRDEEPS